MSAAVQPAQARYVPTQSQLEIAYSVCRGITRGAAKNFYYGFLVLPRRKRQALSAVYAFMRHCDDVADDQSRSLPERREKLAAWLDAFHRAQAGFPTDDPVLLALTDAQQRYEIPTDLLDQLAYGTAMDVLEIDEPGFARDVPVIHYQTFEELSQYCYRVASVVGLVCIRIFGYKDPSAEPLAEQTGLAFQLTNIIRDVKEDAEMSRVYLPEEDMRQFGVYPGDCRRPSDAARMRALLAMEADRARAFYEAGDKLIPLIHEDSQPALWVLVTIYRGLLEKIAARQYDVFGEKVRLSVTEKVRILVKGFLKRLY
jgi:phytoene synthase